MKKFLLIILLLSTTIIFANNLNLSLTGIGNFNEFYASYLDPDNIANQPILFTGNIQNRTAQNFKFYLTLEILWNNQHLLDESDGKINSIIPINANQVWTFTNQDVINNIASGYFNANINIDNIKNKIKDFEDVLMETGKFPDGKYIFRFRAYDLNNNLISNTEEYSFTIINYSAITLIQPGLQLGRGILEIPDNDPIFIWNSNAREYIFKLYHLQSENNSPDQLNSTRPIFETTISQNSFRYPTSAPTLENNQIYAWKIEIENQDGTNSNNTLTSNYFVFKLNTSSSQNGQYNQIVVFLQNLGINSEQLKNLVRNGYLPTGLISINGKTITQEEWNDILNKIISGQIKIKSVNVN
jgi:hypothetical protein